MTDAASTPSAQADLATRVRRGRSPRVRPETHEPQREPEGRAERVPLGVQRLQLTADKRPGFVRRWMNDQGDRLNQAQQGGYSFVLDAKGEKITRSNKSDAMRIYLMEIREEWFLADQATKQKSVDAVENQIRRGELTGKVGQDGVYVPSRGIKVRRAPA